MALRIPQAFLTVAFGTRRRRFGLPRRDSSRRPAVTGILAAVFAVSLSAQAAILPDDLGAFHRASIHAVTPADQPLWHEYGFQQGESATYASGDQKFTVTACRMQDAT